MTRREEELLRAVLAAADERTLRAAVEVARVTVDEGGGTARLVDALDDLDAYCERCDDAGVVVRHLATSMVTSWTVEVPCECEASRIIREQRRAQR